jgi:hypothetical protein
MKKERRPKTAEVGSPTSEPVTGAMNTTTPLAFPLTTGAADLIGRKVDPLHRNIFDIYQRTRTLCERKDLPPYAARNLRKSLACLWQIVNDAGIDFEHLYDIGV